MKPPGRLLAPLLFGLLALSAGNAWAQDATVREEEQVITTYPFSDPNPLPSLVIDEDRFRFYPYFTFDGFAREAKEQTWKVLRLENPYIEVTVLPEVGGKVWGGVEKSTGDEFVYQNDVLKFRSIGIRGPWTSGGIEHNFGLDLGHTPATATPVDYKIQKAEDGSVSVVVGAMDLPTRTKWRVTIRVPKDKAYFETNSVWYNPTPLHHSYLSWENMAFEARDDLQFFFPGQYYVGHGGDAHPWPIDEEGRDLSYYRNNDFGGHKSYHVMGTYTDYYAAYWHDAEFGMGHWAPYAEAPGKKIWIWSLARSGAIWEDLLTDTDGQYVELQSGVKFNQAGLHSGTQGPFNQLLLDPYRTDRKHEVWFPIKQTGGIVDASPYGTLNVTRADQTLQIAVNALQALCDTLAVTVGGRPVHRELLCLDPMEVYRTQVAVPSDEEEAAGPVRVTVGRHKLVYSSDSDAEALDRPVVTPEGQEVPSAERLAERLFRTAEDQMSMRKYDAALETYAEVLERAPTHSRALTRMAELYYRRAQYQKGLDYATRVLEQNAYDPGANFIYGVLQRQLGDLVNAKDGLAWAARSMKYRAGAYAQMASILLQERTFEEALTYATWALDYDRTSLPAYRALAIAHRHLQQEDAAQEVLRRLLEVDPLSHFARFEQYLLDPTLERKAAFQSMIRNELPHETYLELAMTYVHADLSEEAVRVLKMAPPYPIVDYWLAYLHRDASSSEATSYLAKALAVSPRFVFPFRLETLPVLQWAARQDDAWKTSYYLGLLYWSKRRTDAAKELFAQCGEAPDFAPFYVARGHLFEAGDAAQAEQDFERAVQEADGEWRTWHALVTFYNEQAQYDKALRRAEEAYARFPDSYIIGMDEATSLFNNKQYADALAALEGLHVLPYEGAREGHTIYERSKVLFALERFADGDYAAAVRLLKAAKDWPEHLGAGKPHAPDTRLLDYLIARSYQRLGRPAQASAMLEDIAAYTEENWTDWGANHYIGALAFRALGKTEKARRLLTAWQEANGSNKKMAQWATARFNGEERKAQQLEQALLEQEEEGGLRWGSDQAVLYRALEAVLPSSE